MPHLINRHRKKLLLLVFLVLVVCGWLFWNRPKKDDMAAYVPADALGFIEVNDLDALAQGIGGTEAWRTLAGPLGAPSSLLPQRGLIQLARWTGLGTAEAVLAARSQVALVVTHPRAMEDSTTHTIKPAAGLCTETHTQQRLMRPVLDMQVERLAQLFYGQPKFARKLIADADLGVWSS